MMTVKGRYRDGNIHLSEVVNYRESEVLVIFLDESDEGRVEAGPSTEWDNLNNLIEECQVKTGISDLAHQHDHYQHSTPKQGID